MALLHDGETAITQMKLRDTVLNKISEREKENTR